MLDRVPDVRGLDGDLGGWGIEGFEEDAVGRVRVVAVAVPPTGAAHDDVVAHAAGSGLELVGLDLGGRAGVTPYQCILHAGQDR